MAQFVGRAEELAALRGLISRARRERAPAAALISGEPGSGKSRLLREAIPSVAPGQLVLLTGFEPTQTVPLAAAGDLMRRLTRVPEHGPLLRALVFSPGGVREQGVLPAFEAAHRAVGASGPLVIAVDDLQWFDEQSLGLLSFLIKAAESARQPLAVLAAARPSAATASYQDAISAVLPEGRRRSLTLRGLSREAGIELAQAIDQHLDIHAAEEFWRRAAGSPFWVEALAHGHGSTDSTDLVTHRLRALSPDASELLSALAVGGRPFTRELVAEMVGWDEARVDQAARELVARGLALEEYGSVRLAHDLIREAVAATLPGPYRQHLHHRLADLLEGRAGQDLDLLSEALDHSVAAGLPVAGLAARILTSPQRRLVGFGGLRRLTSIVDGLPAESVERLGLEAEIATLAGVLGDQQVAMTKWKRLAEADPTPVGRQNAALEAAIAAFRLGRALDARTHLDRAREAAPSAPQAEARIEALNAEVALWLDHDAQGGAAAAAQSLDAARTMADEAEGLEHLSPAARQTYVTALEASMGAAMQQERFADIRQFSEEILPVARTLPDEGYVAALLRSGFALRPLGAIQVAEELYREAWDIAHRSVLPFPMIDAGIGLTRALRDLGRLEEAREVGRETVELEARLGSPPGRWGNAVAVLHVAELSIGDGDALELVAADSRAHPNPHFRMWIHQLLASWQARLGAERPAGEVRESIRLGLADAAAAGCQRCGGELSIASVEALARIGAPDEARGLLDAWEARGVPEYPWQGMLRLRAQASIAMSEGDRAAAVDLLGRLRDALEGESLLDDLVWVHLDLGAVNVSVDRSAAIQAYTDAATLAETIGAKGRARLAARELRRLGVRAWHRGPRAASGGLLSLSQREREIAGLVAAGATNVEVANSLAITPKTVERHVTNILAKLGARNRTELAGLVQAGPGTGFPR